MAASASPATIRLRASENAQQCAAPSQVKVASTAPVSRSHTFTRVVLRSRDRAPPVRASPPPPRTASAWPVRVRSSRPLSTSHTFSVLSSRGGDRHAARPHSPPRQTDSSVAGAGCAARARFPRPTPSAFGHRRRRPPAARPHSPPRQRQKQSALAGCAVRGRFPGPTPSAFCPQTRRPPAARRHSTPRHRQHFGVADQGAQLAAAFQVPHFQHPVSREASGDRSPPVPTHRHATARGTVVRVRVREFAPAFQVPHLQRLVIRGGDRPPPVPTHRHAIDSIRVALQGAQLAPSFPASHTFSVVSVEAETARLPSALTATPLTRQSGRAKVRSSRPLSRSHTFSVPSNEAETARRPSALTATPSTLPEWPAKVRSFAARSPNPTPSASGPQRRRPPAARPYSAPRPVEHARVAGKRSQFATAFHVPHLQRRIRRGGDRPPPVSTQRHATDRS